MARIKMTAYIDTDELGEGEHDPDDPTGLTEGAYLAFTLGRRTPLLDDIEFELESE